MSVTLAGFRGTPSDAAHLAGPSQGFSSSERPSSSRAGDYFRITRRAERTNGDLMSPIASRCHGRHLSSPFLWSTGHVSNVSV